MSFEQLALSIIGNIFLVVLVIRAFGAYLKKEWGDLITELVFAVILAGFIYFTDQMLAVLKFLWNITIGAWFGMQVH
ncbi:hypothetical protein GCM10027414_36780 [Humibacter ginsengiterrae]|jgi:hypothetical protein